MPQDVKAATMDFQSAALVAPAGDDPVGGDFQVIHCPDDSRVVLVMGDVTGRGREAAPYADQLCADVKAIADSTYDPADFLEDLNTRICEDAEFDRYVTACVIM